MLKIIIFLFLKTLNFDGFFKGNDVVGIRKCGKSRKSEISNSIWCVVFYIRYNFSLPEDLILNFLKEMAL